jgi:hypothetical protein
MLGDPSGYMGHQLGAIAIGIAAIGHYRVLLSLLLNAGLDTLVPPEVKKAIAQSVERTKKPTSDDKEGNYHEEGGIWGLSGGGTLVVAPAKPGPYSDPATWIQKRANHERLAEFVPENSSEAASIREKQGCWHTHFSGTYSVPGKKTSPGTVVFGQGTEVLSPDFKPSPWDLGEAGHYPVNIVVALGNKTVYFYNSVNAEVEKYKLKDFLK